MTTNPNQLGIMPRPYRVNGEPMTRDELIARAEQFGYQARANHATLFDAADWLRDNGATVTTTQQHNP